MSTVWNGHPKESDCIWALAVFTFSFVYFSVSLSSTPESKHLQY